MVRHILVQKSNWNSFLFSRNLTVLGGSDVPEVDVVLFGEDHRRPHNKIEFEHILLSEVYEFKLAADIPRFPGLAHLLIAKLHFATYLADYGLFAKSRL